MTQFWNSGSSHALGIYNNIHEILVGPNCLGCVIGRDLIYLGVILDPQFKEGVSHLGCFGTPRTRRPGFSHDSWSSHDDVMMTLVFSC